MLARRSVITLALAASIAATPLVQPHAQDANRTIKIGVLTDFSSAYAEYSGKYSLLGTQMAVEDFLAAHPNRHVEVVSADHQNKPDVGSAIARNWIDNEHIDAFGDMSTSAVVLAVMKLAAPAKKIVLVASGNSGRITGEECNPYTVQWPYDIKAPVVTALRAVADQGAKSFYFVTVDNVSGAEQQMFGEQTIAKFGGTVAGSVKHPFNSADFSSFMLQAQASKADVIVLANQGLDTARAIKAAADFGMTAKQKMVSPFSSINDIPTVGLELAQGLYTSAGYYWDRDDRSRAFSKRFTDRIGRPPAHNHTANYSATWHYLNAIEAAGTMDSDRIMAQMRATKVDDVYTATGKLRADGQMVHDQFLLQVKKPSESTGKWDIMKVMGTVRGDDIFTPLAESRCPMIRKS